MKILYFVYFIRSGAAIHVDEFSKAFSSLNHEFKTFDLSSDICKEWDNADKQLRKNNRNSILSRYGWGLRRLFQNIGFFLKEWKILSREHPDVIIARLPVYIFSIVLLARLKSIPIVLEVNAPIGYETRKYDKEHFHFYPILKVIEYICYKMASHITTVTQALKDCIILEYNISEEKIMVNHNGVDPIKFYPSLDNRYILEKYNLNNKLVVGFVGSFAPWHDIMNLVEVAKEIIDSNKNIFILLVGDGPLKKQIEEFIYNNKLADNVIMTGEVKHQEINAYIGAMDIAIMPPTLFYASPLKIFEYMAMEKVVIAPKTKAMQEIIKENEEGILISNEKESLKNALGLLIEDESLRKRLGKSARKRVLADFTWEMNAKRVWNSCKDICKAWNGLKI